MHRIYKENIDKDCRIYKLIDQDYHHAVNVLRLKNGDNVIMFSGSFEGVFKIENISKKSADLVLIDKVRDCEIMPEIHLLASIVKGDKMSQIVDTATQFGVKSITPIISENCHIRDFNYDRMNAVAVSALCQSKGMVLPVLNNITKIQDIAGIVDGGALLFGDLSNRSTITSSLKIENNSKIFCIIGPEGGFSDMEAEFLYSINNARGVRLSRRVLRSEIAVGAILSLANTIFEGWV